MATETELPTDPAALGIVVGVLLETLSQTLVKLAAAHGNQDGHWLHELEADATRTIKATYTTTLALEIEHVGVATGLALAVERFQALRLALRDHRQDDPFLS